MASAGFGKVVAVAGAVAAGLGIVAIASARGGGGGERAAPGTTRGGACTDTAEQAARYGTVTRLRGWVNCTGRTGEEVMQLAAALRTAGRGTDASAVERTWNARRRVEDAPPGGTASLSPAARQEAEAAVSGPAPRDVPPDPANATGATPTGVSERVRSDAPGSGSTAVITRERGSRESAGSPGGFDPADSPNYDPRRARELASRTARIARNVRPDSQGRISDERQREWFIEFQEAAGLETDGVYGGMTSNALRYYGISNPPPVHRGPSPSAPEAQYVPSRR